MNLPQEYVILVDEQDTALGLEEKMKAHELGLLHRAFSVFIYCKTQNSVEILLQQRAHEKYHCAGLWANTCCSHPRMGETNLEAANRRLFEEMGMSASLKEIGTFIYRADFDNGLTEYELDHVFIGEVNNRDEAIAFNTDEVASYQWISLESLVSALEQSCDQFTPWLKPALALAKASF